MFSFLPSEARTRLRRRGWSGSNWRSLWVDVRDLSIRRSHPFGPLIDHKFPGLFSSAFGGEPCSMGTATGPWQERPVHAHFALCSVLHQRCVFLQGTRSLLLSNGHLRCVSKNSGFSASCNTRIYGYKYERGLFFLFRVPLQKVVIVAVKHTHVFCWWLRFLNLAETVGCSM
jgi:hypothetical protein